MLILFDHVTPKGVARALVGHTVTKAKDRGWDTFSNGDLLAAAAKEWGLMRQNRNARHQHGSVFRPTRQEL